MKLIPLSVFILVCYFRNTEGTVSKATQNITDTVLAECTVKKLTTYMQRASSSGYLNLLFIKDIF